MSDTTSTLLDINQASAALRVTPETLRNYAKRGAVKFLRIGTGQGRFRFRPEDIEEFLDSCAGKSPTRVQASA